MWPTGLENKTYRVLLDSLGGEYCVPILIVDEPAYASERARWSDSWGVYAYEVDDWYPGVRKIYFENGLPPAYIERRELRMMRAMQIQAAIEAELREQELRTALLLMLD